MSLLLAALTATWTDAPALLAEAVKPVEAEIAACMKTAHPIGVVATRGKDGTTQVHMPVYGVGGRGYTPEERCLMKVVARIALPALPADIAELSFVIPVDGKAAGWDAWRDLTAPLVDRAAVTACLAKKGSARIVLDLRKGATRAWLPAWQFKASATPKACLTKVLAKPLPALPAGLGLQLAISP